MNNTPSNPNTPDPNNPSTQIQNLISAKSSEAKLIGDQMMASLNNNDMTTAISLAVKLFNFLSTDGVKSTDVSSGLYPTSLPTLNGSNSSTSKNSSSSSSGVNLSLPNNMCNLPQMTPIVAYDPNQYSYFANQYSALNMNWLNMALNPILGFNPAAVVQALSQHQQQMQQQQQQQAQQSNNNNSQLNMALNPILGFNPAVVVQALSQHQQQMQQQQQQQQQAQQSNNNNSQLNTSSANNNNNNSMDTGDIDQNTQQVSSSSEQQTNSGKSNATDNTSVSGKSQSKNNLRSIQYNKKKEILTEQYEQAINKLDQYYLNLPTGIERESRDSIVVLDSSREEEEDLNNSIIKIEDTTNEKNGKKRERTASLLEYSKLYEENGKKKIKTDERKDRPNSRNSSNRKLVDPTTDPDLYINRFSVPGDNSCLFYSIYFLLNGDLNKKAALELRTLVSKKVLTNSTGIEDFFGELTLGKPINEYCEWIQLDTTWGGAIELSILAKHYEMCINVIDVKTGRVDRYSEEYGQKKSIYLLYNGTHYDPLFAEKSSTNQKFYDFKQENGFTAKIEEAFLTFADTYFEEVACPKDQRNLLTEKENEFPDTNTTNIITDPIAIYKTTNELPRLKLIYLIKRAFDDAKTADGRLSASEIQGVREFFPVFKKIKSAQHEVHNWSHWLKIHQLTVWNKWRQTPSF